MTIWTLHFSVPDVAWQITTTSGVLYKQFVDVNQALERLCGRIPDAGRWEEFVRWKRSSGRSCMRFSLIKMAQQRQRERQDHGPFEEL